MNQEIQNLMQTYQRSLNEAAVYQGALKLREAEKEEYHETGFWERIKGKYHNQGGLRR